MAVRVVKEYAATSDFVLVILLRRVDLPTEGKPTRAMRASPDLLTSKPLPAPPPVVVGSSSWARRRASLLVGGKGGVNWVLVGGESSREMRGGRTLLADPGGILRAGSVSVIGEVSGDVDGERMNCVVTCGLVLLRPLHLILNLLFARPTQFCLSNGPDSPVN